MYRFTIDHVWDFLFAEEVSGSKASRADPHLNILPGHILLPITTCNRI